MTTTLAPIPPLQLGPYGPLRGLWPYRHPVANQGSRLTGTILIVDDEASVREVVADFLDFEGYRVETAADGAEAILAVARVRPALIILDMRMPVMNGWGFAHTLRRAGVEIPILVLTAAQDARRWAEEISADGYVGKPFDLDELLAAVENLLSHSTGR